MGTGSAGTVLPDALSIGGREQSASDEMRIADRLFQRRDDGDAAIGRGEQWLPFPGRARGDELRHRVARGLRIAPVVDKLRRQCRSATRTPSRISAPARRRQLILPSLVG